VYQLHFRDCWQLAVAEIDYLVLIAEETANDGLGDGLRGKRRAVKVVAIGKSGSNSA